MAENSPNSGAGTPPRPPSGFSALAVHISSNRVTFALWAIRLATMWFTFCYFVPIWGSPYNLYYKALMANAATSALRLHQRAPSFRLDRTYLGSLVKEDSFHYMFYSLVFIFCTPLTIVLLPIFLFALLHFCGQSLVMIDCLGLNSMWIARMMISLVEVQSVNILRLVAFTEIIIMPLVVMMVFRGAASLAAPFAYYRFLAERYASRRNPYTKTMFHEMRISTEYLVSKPACPRFIRDIAYRFIGFICRLAPPL